MLKGALPHPFSLYVGSGSGTSRPARESQPSTSDQSDSQSAISETR